MANRFLQNLFTPSVLAAQEHYYGRARAPLDAPECDPLGEDESAFIGARDSFYLATVSEDGWPYVQHRGGARGFLRVLDPTRLAFADYKGNRQLRVSSSSMSFRSTGTASNTSHRAILWKKSKA